MKSKGLDRLESLRGGIHLVPTEATYGTENCGTGRRRARSLCGCCTLRSVGAAIKLMAAARYPRNPPAERRRRPPTGWR